MLINDLQSFANVIIKKMSWIEKAENTLNVFSLQYMLFMKWQWIEYYSEVWVGNMSFKQVENWERLQLLDTHLNKKEFMAWSQQSL